MFFLTILIARYLGVAGYGKFSFAFAFVALFAVLADFGLSTLTIREVARNKKLAKKYIDNIAVIKLILGIITFALIITFAQFLGETPEIRILIYLAGAWAIINSFTDFFRSVFRSFEKMQYEAISKITYSIILFGIAIYMIYAKLGLIDLVKSYVIASLVALIITLIMVRKKFVDFKMEFDPKFWKHIFKEAWPFAFGIMASVIYYKIDIVMLGIVRTNTEVGIYNAAYNLISLILIPTGIIISVFLPIISKNYKKKIGYLKKNINRYFKILSIFIIPLSIFLIFFRERLIILVYGLEYIQAVNVLLILAASYVIVSYMTIFGNILKAYNLQKLNLYGTSAGAIINISINFILIPTYGYYGAAISTFISNSLVCGVTYYFYKKFILKKRYMNNTK